MANIRRPDRSSRGSDMRRSEVATFARAIPPQAIRASRGGKNLQRHRSWSALENARSIHFLEYTDRFGSMEDGAGTVARYSRLRWRAWRQAILNDLEWEL